MTSKQKDDKHLEFLTKAFDNDGFNVTQRMLNNKLEFTTASPKVGKA